MMFQPLNDHKLTNPPRSVEEVVDLLFIDLSLRERGILANLTEDKLESSIYLAIAKVIRKEFGLYNGNTALLASCRSYMGNEYDLYEDPAMVIIKELWKKVKKSHHLRIVKRR